MDPSSSQIASTSQSQLPPLTPARPIRRQAPKSDQPTPEELANLGIKVRDFAYESTLPPIRAYVPRQIQPHRQPTDPDIPSSQPSNLRRVPYFTRHVRQPALGNIGGQSSRTGLSLDCFGSSQQSDFSTPSSSQPPLSYQAESQESEPYVRTPTVTPNGSLQWDIQDTSARPASQLDAHSQIQEPELLSYADLGFSDLDESSQSQAQMPPSQIPIDAHAPSLSQLKSQRQPSRVPTEVGSNFSSPLSSPPGSLRSIPTTHTPDDPFIDSMHILPHAPASTTIPPTLVFPAPQHVSESAPSPPRYHFRKRPAPPSVVSNVSRPRSRPRRDSDETGPSTQPPPPSLQSAHAKTKARGRVKPLRPLPVRRSTRPTPVR